MMASLDEDSDVAGATVPHQPWPRIAQLPERLAAARFAPEAFRKEIQDANTLACVARLYAHGLMP